jgi:hypothetical protein
MRLWGAMLALAMLGGACGTRGAPQVLNGVTLIR